MSDYEVERIIINTRFSMEMEGFSIDEGQTETIRKILKGELDKDAYFASLNEKARRYSS